MKMLDIIKKSGIAGAGGAGFPTHIKLNAKADTFIVNAAECEPLLNSDRILMKRFPDKIIEGIKIVKELINFKKCFIGIKKKNKDVAEIIKSNIDVDYIEVFILDDAYPVGDEQILIYEITKKVVPEGGIPLDIGIVVNNVETVYKIYKAVKENEPFVKRHVSILGDVEKAAVFELPIGVSFEDILNYAGKKYPAEEYVAIDGGPMMGKITDIKKGFVKKTTSGIIFLRKDRPLVLKKTQSLKNIINQAKAACCNCMSCTELCSRNLIGHKIEPHKIMRSIGFENSSDKPFLNAFLCSECNICELYACPIGLSPKTVNVYLKNKFRSENKRLTDLNKNPEAKPYREGRKIPSVRLINRLGLSKYNFKLNYEEYDKFFDKLTIFLSQHIGKSAKAVVKEGDTVKKGDVIAEADGDFSSFIHSPLDGKVVLIDGEKIIIEV
jgi:Na+-translocating ferredoxin:NAD+ oxidoreductase RnfC subunit